MGTVTVPLPREWDRMPWPARQRWITQHTPREADAPLAAPQSTYRAVQIAREAAKRKNAEYRASVTAPPGAGQHGTVWQYQRHRCRCDACCDAMRAKTNRQRKRRKARTLYAELRSLRAVASVMGVSVTQVRTLLRESTPPKGRAA